MLAFSHYISNMTVTVTVTNSKASPPLATVHFLSLDSVYWYLHSIFLKENYIFCMCKSNSSKQCK